MANAEEAPVKQKEPDVQADDTGKAAKPAEPTMDFLDETQQRAVAAYVAYVEAERQLENAYKDQEQKAEKAYSDSLDHTRRTSALQLMQQLTHATSTMPQPLRRRR